MRFMVHKNHKFITLDPDFHGTEDPERRKFIQWQLFLLLHAHKCRKVASDMTRHWYCSLPDCGTMKQVHDHLDSCKAGPTCELPECSSSRQILDHFQHCFSDRCIFCAPVNLGHTGESTRKPWQQSITEVQRGLAVDLLAQNFSSIIDAKVTENSVYRLADTLTDYYRIMAAKKWDKEMDIEDRQSHKPNGPHDMHLEHYFGNLI